MFLTVGSPGGPLFLQEHCFMPVYRKGSQNGNADGLSQQAWPPVTGHRGRCQPEKKGGYGAQEDLIPQEGPEDGATTHPEEGLGETM